MDSENTSESNQVGATANSDNISIGASSFNNLSSQCVQKKYQIELNIKLLYVSDPKYFNQPFKIYWARGKKMIDTRKAIVKPETQIAKFNDKFSMKTVLQWDEELQEFKPKPVSTTIPFHLTILLFPVNPTSEAP